MTAPTLPAMRPSPTQQGPDVVNDRPVSDPEKEFDAIAFNQMKADVAQMGGVSPLAIVRVGNNGTVASVEKVLGVNPSLVTAERGSAGFVAVTFDPSLGIAIEAATATPKGATKHGVAFDNGGNIIAVLTDSNDVPFTLVIW